MHESLTSNDKRVFIFQENIGEVRNICLPKKKKSEKTFMTSNCKRDS
jgi:hypothetical protein